MGEIIYLEVYKIYNFSGDCIFENAYNILSPPFLSTEIIYTYFFMIYYLPIFLYIIYNPKTRLRHSLSQLLSTN